MGRELRKINTLRKFALSSTAGNRELDPARVDRGREPELRDSLAQSHRGQKILVYDQRVTIFMRTYCAYLSLDSIYGIG